MSEEKDGFQSAGRQDSRQRLLAVVCVAVSMSIASQAVRPFRNLAPRRGLTGMILLSLLFALGFAAIHLFIGRLPIGGPVPRSVWLSAAGGISVAYVFLHLLPELAGHRETVETGLEMENEVAEMIIFLVALVGLTAFYGLEKLVKLEKRGEAGADMRVFMIHLGSFAAYTALIAYLLVQRENRGWSELVLYGTAMATHFLSADFGLRQDHAGRYDHFGRWLLAGAVLSGWGLA